MDKYNEGSTSDRDDYAVVGDQRDSDAVAGGDTADVGATTPGIADTTVGAVNAADAEFAASGAQVTGATDAGTDDGEPSEPVDRFDDQPVSSGPELSAVPSTLQPNTQADDPIYAELGDEGQGDLSPEDQL